MRRAGMFWGIALIVVGILLLLNTLGILNVNVWGLIWPVLLVLFGFSILWRTLAGPRRGEVEQVSIPLEGASRARVKIDFGAGRLQLDGGAAPDTIVSGAFGGGLEHKSQMDGDTLKVRLRVPSEEWWAMPWMWGGYRREWTVHLNPQVPLALDVDAGACEGHLDLTRVPVQDLKLNIGASSADVALPANAGNTRVDVDAGAASVKMRVPAGAAARIRFQGGAASFEADPARFPRAGAYHQSADYETAANKIDIQVNAGAGSVKVY